MSDEYVMREEEPRTEKAPTTEAAAHGDHKVGPGDERCRRIAPAELAMVRAIIDAALARRS
ncbi:MAG: hypothetical protein ACR2JW_04325 [Thermomicrobiales bacterium]